MTSRAAPALLLALAACGCSANALNPGGGKSPDAAAPPADLQSLDLAVGIPCGDKLCAVGDLCELGSCHRDCGTSARCGDAPMETCCPMGDICYLGACTTPGMPCGAAPRDGGVADGGMIGGGGCAMNKCANGEYCEPSIGRCLPLAKTGMCEFHPPVGSFAPRVKWEWQGGNILAAYNQIMMTPMVGDIDGDCMPDVVFATFAAGNYGGDGVLRAVRGDGKGELWTVTDGALRVVPGAQLALADTDGDGRMEVFACAATKQLLAFNFDGTKRWISSDAPCHGYDAPSVANVDHVGAPEVVVGFSVHNSQTGALIGKPPAVPSYGNYGPYTVAVELDDNAQNGLELAAGNIVYHADGTLYWDQSGGATGYPAVGDLDGDGRPDLACVDPTNHTVSAFTHDGKRIWGPVDVNNGVATPKGPNGGGPPTIADFDGDGHPDVATAGGYGYLILVGATGKVLWQSTMTTDTSSRVTGSSVFDFEGDGPAEAVYNDEHNLRVYSGKDGKVLAKLCSTSGTLWEYPVVVDVDADDHAEIVVMNNNYAFPSCDLDVGGGASHTGFKVIGDAMNRWVRTRRIWNQHTYHVTNIDDDGRVPKDEPANWQQPGLNNFRQNVQTKNVFAAPDLVPKDLRGVRDRCMQGVLILAASVVNQGESVAPAGIPVTFYRDTGMNLVVLGTTTTRGVILPGATETVSVEWTFPMGERGPWDIVVIVDDDQKPMSGVVNECDENNNTSLPASVGCPQIG